MPWKRLEITQNRFAEIIEIISWKKYCIVYERYWIRNTCEHMLKTEYGKSEYQFVE